MLKPENFVPHHSQVFIPSSVVFLLLLMNIPTNFDDQSHHRAVKIDNKRSNNVLTVKFVSSQLVFPNVLPKHGLCWGWIFAHLSRVFN